YSFYSPSENKVFVARNAEFFESKLLDRKASGSVEDLELIQKEDTNPSIDTGLNHEEDDQEIDEPQKHELGDLGKPANYKAALLDPESKKWLDAMNVEMQSMKDYDVWVLVELPLNSRTIGSKWLFKKKTDMDGIIYIFKARLVAKGFTQTYMVDYEETFSPVANIRAIRILIAIAAYYDYEIWKMDVKTAFLNGHLFEKVYMEQPEGFVNLKYPNHVCKLKRSIYGLKQASRQRNKRFDDEIKKFGFTQNPDEPCEYLKAGRSYIAILILYVDDILLMGNNIPMLQDVKSYLGRSFAMKDLGEAAYILEIKIYRDRTKGNMERELRVSCYTDTEYLTDADNLKSQTGYVFVLNGGAIDWKSTKQSIFATSSTDAEYIAAFDASKEAVWIRKFISRLGIVPTIEEPISMYYDNTGAIAIAKDDGVTKGARYFRPKVNYLRETIKLGDIKIEKIDTDDNLADLFTKVLAFPKHFELTRNIGLLPASSFIRFITTSLRPPKTSFLRPTAIKHRRIRLYTTVKCSTSNKQKVIVISGPTGAGKNYSAGNFYDDGRQAAKDILNRGRVLIVTGGTGLYLRWFIYGKPDVSKATAKISDSSAQSLPANDWYRLHRKLETIKSSGLPPSVFPVPYDSFKGQVDSHSTELGIATSTGAIVEEKQKDLDYNFICFFLSTSRMDLYRSIDLWCEDMISGDKGILSEARWLFDMGLLPNSNSATRAIGYRQAMEYLLNCEAQGGRSSTRNFYAFLSEFQKASRNFAKQTVDIVS
nr:tRNA dimethylallyltransferase 9 [Tanacetum cinerariifolium]